MESSPVLQNRWKLLSQIEEEEHQEEEEQKSRSAVVEEERMKPTTVEEGGEEEEAWTVIQKRRRNRKTRLMDLSADILSHIFLKLGVMEILRSAQYVCSSWRKLSKQPHLFRSIDFRHQWELPDYKMKESQKQEQRKIVRLAISRSCGQLVEFSVDGFVGDVLLRSIVTNISKSNSLQCLRMIGFHIDWEKELVHVIRSVPYLEELDLSCSWSISIRVFEEIGRWCRHLKSFRFDFYMYQEEPDDEVAFAIAKNMPRGLRRLHLCGNAMSNAGLRAILRGCLNLEYLDLHGCSFVKLDGEDALKTQCLERIKSVRLPNPKDYGLNDVCYNCYWYSDPFDDGDYLNNDDYNEDLIFFPPKAYAFHI